MIALLESGRLEGGQFSEGNAVLATGQLAGERAIPALIEELKSSSDHVQQCAATALDRLDRSQTVEPLIETLETAPYLGSRRWAAQLLGSCGDPRVVEPLRAALDAERNDEPGIRSVINISLDELKDSE